MRSRTDLFTRRNPGCSRSSRSRLPRQSSIWSRSSSTPSRFFEYAVYSCPPRWTLWRTRIPKPRLWTPSFATSYRRRSRHHPQHFDSRGDLCACPSTRGRCQDEKDRDTLGGQERRFVAFLSLGIVSMAPSDRSIFYCHRCEDLGRRTARCYHRHHASRFHHFPSVRNRI